MVSLKLPKPRLFTITARPHKRALAFLIDMLIIDMIIFFPFKILFSKLTSELSFASLNDLLNNPELTSLFIASGLAMGLLTILYFSILEFKIQQTIGKIIVKIRVVSEDKENKFWQYLVRSILLIPTFPFILLWFADIIYLAFNQKRQRLLEVVSKTRTIETIVEV